MAATKSITKRLTQPTDDPPPDGFIVTVEREVGRVEFNSHGHENGTVAAFNVIATYEADHPEGGVYRFPTPNGSLAVVAVSYEREDS